MTDKKKATLTKLHLYFLLIGGLLMVASTTFNLGHIDWLLGTLALAIFFPTILTERYIKKRKKKNASHRKHCLTGALLGAVVGGIFTGIPNLLFWSLRYDQRYIFLRFLFTVIGVIVGAIVGFLITYLPKKIKFKQIS